MTAFIRPSLTGRFASILEEFGDGFRLATSRNWVAVLGVPSVVLDASTMVFPGDGMAELLTYTPRYPQVTANVDVPADGLIVLHMQSAANGTSFKIDLNGGVYGDWAGMAKLTTAGGDLGRLWLTPSVDTDHLNFSLLKFDSPANEVWQCQGIRVCQEASASSRTPYRVRFGCSGTTSGATFRQSQILHSVDSLGVLADTAFANGLAPLLTLTISGTTAIHINDPSPPPGLPGDGWPGDGTYQLWQAGTNAWVWKAAPGSNPFSAADDDQDSVTLSVQGSGGSWTMTVAGTDGTPRFSVSSIASGSLNGSTISGYSLTPTTYQNNLDTYYSQSSSCSLSAG